MRTFGRLRHCIPKSNTLGPFLQHIIFVPAFLPYEIIPLHIKSIKHHASPEEKDSLNQVVDVS